MRTTFPTLRRLVMATTLALLLTVALLLPATADQTYSTERLPLIPVAGEPLRSGSVVNIHANGPQVYAHEVYTLNGAMSATTYTVVLNVYLGNLACAGDPDLVIATATLTTNPAGNGAADVFFRPEDTAGLGGLTVSARWQVTRDGVVAYETPCTQISLD